MLKKEVLRGDRQFNTVYNRGKSTSSRYVILFYKKNQLDYNRIAFLASKKVGNAVARNRALLNDVCQHWESCNTHRDADKQGKRQKRRMLIGIPVIDKIGGRKFDYGLDSFAVPDD